MMEHLVSIAGRFPGLLFSAILSRDCLSEMGASVLCIFITSLSICMT
ncbi:MAG: hypothetical protein K0S79_341 [Nitrospira sp.]|nr:hypothetical protein [Nitrospira sp.]